MAGGHGGTKGRRRGSPCEARRGEASEGPAPGCGAAGRPRQQSLAGEDVGEIFPRRFLGARNSWPAGRGRDDRRLASLSLPQTACRVRARRHIGLPSWACGRSWAFGLLVPSGWPGLRAAGPLRHGSELCGVTMFALEV